MTAALWRLSFAFACFGVLAAAFVRPSAAQSASGSELKAEPVTVIPNLDGRLTEAAWEHPEPATDFLQLDPREGDAPSQRTEVRVLYGDDHVYVGAMLHDDRPELIETALGNRDDINRADWFLVSIDSYFDRRTAYIFGVNAAGVQYDALKTGGEQGFGPFGGADDSWDAVWYSDAHVSGTGWSVEMRIPYSMLRFSEAREQTWGIHFVRLIPRLSEQVEWPLVPRSERDNFVAQFGLLSGIEGIDPRRNLQIRPYAVSRLQRAEDLTQPGAAVNDGSFDVGGDVKVGLGSNVTLDATVNPDFGQVESDPAVLNLSAFETFFDERRPFFIEGTQIFQFPVGPGQLLYTRRIGARSPIIGAAKLSGRTAEGLSFGLLGATTGDEFNPSHHYGVARVSRQIGEFSSAGTILTAFNAPAGPQERRSSLVGGADYDLRFRQNRYGVEGFATISHRRLPTEAETGFATKVWMRKRQGDLTGFVGFDVFSDQFQVNDLGQLNENNFFAVLSSGNYNFNGNQPFGPFQRVRADAFGIQQVSYDEGLNLGQNVNMEVDFFLRTFQRVELAVQLQNAFGGYDLYETRGLGPRAQPFEVQPAVEFASDSRRSWRIQPEASIGFQSDGGRKYAAGIGADWNAENRLSLSAEVEAEWEDGVTAWTANETFLRTQDGWFIGRVSAPPHAMDLDDFVGIDDHSGLDRIFSGTDPTLPNRYFIPIFGERDTRSVDLTLRSTVTFTTSLSLQIYSQLFLARGRYEHFQILRTRDDLEPFAGYPKRDEFAFSNLQSNVVLRWEYRPGSRLYFVWTHGRRAEDELNPLAPWGASPYARPLDVQVSDVFDVFPENVFLVKLDYTFLY